MEQSLLTLLSELPGLQASLKVITERMDFIQGQMNGQKAPGPRTQQTGASGGAAPSGAVSAKAPVSQAKLDALAKARAAKAKQSAAPVKVGRKAGMKRGRKAGVAKKKSDAGAAASA